MEYKYWCYMRVVKLFEYFKKFQFYFKKKVLVLFKNKVVDIMVFIVMSLKKKFDIQVCKKIEI